MSTYFKRTPSPLPGHTYNIAISTEVGGIGRTLTLEQFIAGAKSLPFVSSSCIDWNSNRWDLTALVKQARPNEKPYLNFPELSSIFRDFMKAYVLWELGNTIGAPRQILKFSAPVRNARYVQQAMESNGISHPCDLSPEILDEAIGLIEGSPSSQEQNASKISWFVNVLRQFGMQNVPYEWHPPKQIISVSRSNARNRINRDTSEKMLSGDELDALIRAFNIASSPKHRLVASVGALLCCAPMRIQELLALPRNADIYLDPGDGYQAGLRWFPKKGGMPALKFVPNAMVPVAKKALATIKAVTQEAHELALKSLKSPIDQDCWIDSNHYPHFPYIDEDKRVKIDNAMFVKIKANKVRLIDYSYVAKRLSGANQASVKTIFEELGIRLPDGSFPDINTHKPRHYLNTIANRSSVPQADIAKWSGRKSIHQNIVYDHEKPEELACRLRGKIGKVDKRVPKVVRRDQFDAGLIQEAIHSTPSGWCMQSLRQNPCEMFGACLNCTHLVCIKGADEKLSHIKSELELAIKMKSQALEKAARGMSIDGRWLQQYELKVQRLTELVSILEDEQVEDGTAIRLADQATALVQYNSIETAIDRINSQHLTAESQQNLGHLFDEEK